MRVIEQSAEIQDWRDLDLYERVETAARVCRRSESKGDAKGFVQSLIRRGHFSPLEFARVGFEGFEGDVREEVKPYNVRRAIEEYLFERREYEDNEEYFDSNSCNRVLALAISYPVFIEQVHPAAVGDRDTCSWYGCKPINDWIPVLITTSRTISHQLVRYRHDICFMQESQRHVRYDKTGIEVIEPPGLDDFCHRAFEVVCERAEYHYATMIKHGATAEQARAVLPGCTATRILAYASPAEWRHIFSQRCDKHADPQMRALMEPLQEEMLERGLI